MIQDERGVADTSLNLTRLALLEENYSEAVSFSTETLQLHRATGDNAAIASSLTMLGFSLLLTAVRMRRSPLSKKRSFSRPN